MRGAGSCGRGREVLMDRLKLKLYPLAIAAAAIFAALPAGWSRR